MVTTTTKSEKKSTAIAPPKQVKRSQPPAKTPDTPEVAGEADKEALPGDQEISVGARGTPSAPPVVSSKPAEPVKPVAKSSKNAETKAPEPEPLVEEGEEQKELGPEEKKDQATSAAPPPEEGSSEEGKKAELGPLAKKKFPDVKKDLEKTSKNVCGNAAEKTQQLAVNEKDHDTAGEKVIQTEEAVEPPANEGQSESNSAQIDTLEGKQEPKPSEDSARNSLNEAIDRSVPKTLEDLDNFKKKGMAKGIGDQVTGVVTQDVKAVDATYSEIESTPEPKPSKKTPKPIPAVKGAPETPKLDLGKEAVPGLESAHTDFKVFEEESDHQLKQEGISDEELSMVDSGDLLEARKERKGIKNSVNAEPKAARQYAQSEKRSVDVSMQQEEQGVRKQMTDKRKKQLNDVKTTQQGTKTGMEKKREGVVKHINTIYENARKKIKTKLDALEKDSMRKFDKAQEKFSEQFEDEVNADINTFKEKRYSGPVGWALKGKDWLMGIDDFPEVEKAFSDAKERYVNRIDGLIVTITKENEAVIRECKTELSNARKEIKKYVSTLGPDLKKAGEKAMQDMQKKLDELDEFIDQKEQELQKKLCDKKEAAIKKIDQKIEKMKESLSGALSKLANLLLNAMLKFFKWVLGKFGMDEGALMNVINKGARIIKKIVLHPIDFIMNLVRGVGQGITNFGLNIKKHLISGVVEWLTGPLGSIGLQLPEKWDLKGIMHLVLQILGLTWSNIRARLVKQLGEETVSRVEKTVDIVKRVITEGPIALWEMLKEKAAEIKQTVMEGIRNWVITNIVNQGIIMLASFLSPAGAIIQAIKTIYNVVMWLIDNFERIVTFVKTVFGAIADIAFGRLGKVAAAVERGLAMIIPIILDFMAKLLNLGGITKAVKKVIAKVRKPINKVIDKVIRFVVKKAKKLFKAAKKFVKAGVKKGKKVAGKIVKWWRNRKKFKAEDGETHQVYFKGSQSKPHLMIASTEQNYETFIRNVDVKGDGKKATAKKQALAIAREIDEVSSNNKLKDEQKESKLNDLFAQLVVPTGKLFGGSMTTGEVKYGGLRNGFGTSMSVIPLAKAGPSGSSPTQAQHGEYDKLNKRRTSSGASYYIRGHLLNENLHGPGEWKNMTPLSRTGNSQHESQVESKVKSAVGSGLNVSYKVIPDYGSQPGKSGLLKAVDNSTEDNKNEKQAKREIIEAEDNVPLGLKCWAVSINQSKKEEPKLGLKVDKWVQNPIERNYKDYHLSGVPKPPPVNLNEDNSVEKLKELPGIGDSRANSIRTSVRKRKQENKTYVTYTNLATDSEIPISVFQKLREKELIILK